MTNHFLIGVLTQENKSMRKNSLFVMEQLSSVKAMKRKLKDIRHTTTQNSKAIMHMAPFQTIQEVRSSRSKPRNLSEIQRI